MLEVLQERPPPQLSALRGHLWERSEAPLLRKWAKWLQRGCPGNSRGRAVQAEGAAIAKARRLDWTWRVCGKE